MVRNISPEAHGLLWQVRLEVSRNARSRRFLLFGLAIPIAIYVIYLAAGIGGANGQPIDGIAWPAYLMVSMAAFGAMNASVGVAAGTRQDASGARSGVTPAARNAFPGPNVVVRAVSAMVLALPPLILIGSVAALDGIRLQGVDWLLLITSLWIGALPFVVLGLVLGRVLDADTSDVVLLGTVVVLAILGGLFQPIQTLPGELAGLARVLPSYRLADLGWTAIAGRTVNPVDALVLAGYTIGFGAIAVWHKRVKDARIGT